MTRDVELFATVDGPPPPVGMTARPSMTVTAEERGRTERLFTEPSVTITSRPPQWATVSDEVLARLRDQTGTPIDLDWPAKRPATTVAGRDLVQHPGATANRHNGATKSRNDGIRISVEEAATLQGFPPGYPWHGGRNDRYRQIGDAVPPLLGVHFLAHVLGVDLGGSLLAEAREAVVAP